MASTFRRLHFMEKQYIAGDEETKRPAAGLHEESKSGADQKTIRRLEIKRMLFLDEFFLLVGHSTTDPDKTEHLYLVKENNIRETYRLHANTYEFKKCVLRDSKSLVSIGHDEEEHLSRRGFSASAISESISAEGPVSRGHESSELNVFIKIWDYNNLLDNSTRYLLTRRLRELAARRRHGWHPAGVAQPQESLPIRSGTPRL